MAMSLSSLALVFENRREYTKALPLVEQALKIREAAFGIDHPRLVPGLEQVCRFAPACESDGGGRTDRGSDGAY